MISSAHPMRRVAVVLAMAAVAACGPSDGADTTPAKPSDLIGQWLVTGDDVEEGTVLNVDAGGMDIFTSCGISGTQWKATRGGAFLAEITSGVGNCFHRSQTIPKADPAWIEDAAALGIDRQGRLLLLDDSDDPIGVLTPTTQPPEIPSPAAYTTSDDDTKPPKVSTKARAALDRPGPVFPAGIQPASTADLLGLWVPTGGEDAYLWFKPSGEYRGSDGCNGMGGRWRVRDGRLLWTLGGMTEMWCTDMIDPIHGVALAGIDGAELVLFNAKGRESLRMIHAPTPTTAERKPAH